MRMQEKGLEWGKGFKLGYTGAKRIWSPGHRWQRQPREGGDSLSGIARGKAESKAARLLTDIPA